LVTIDNWIPEKAFAEWIGLLKYKIPSRHDQVKVKVTINREGILGTYCITSGRWDFPRI
jgi:hypothetical protein